MSDKIDLNTNNLCITEDAFEKFQVDSMYEEDEYITLSDIVPPQPVQLDLPIELQDIPYENEVVLESLLEEQVPVVNSTIECVAEENRTLEIVPDEELPPSDNVQEVVTELVKPKRGRKKKCPQGELIHEKDNFEGIPEIQEKRLQDDEPSSTPDNQSKRSRRPRKTYYEYIEQNYMEEIDKNGDTPQKSKRKSSKKSTPTVSEPAQLQNEVTSQIKTSLPRRGKAKKPPQEQLPESESKESTSPKETETINQSVENTVETKIPTRRGRKRKVPLLESSNNEKLSDGESSKIKSEKLNKQRENIEESVALPNDNQVLANKPTPCKRGRPRKTNNNCALIPNTGKVNETLASNIQIENDTDVDLKKSQINDEDDADDICLSTLKKTFTHQNTNYNCEPEESEVRSEFTEPKTDVDDENSKMEFDSDKLTAKPETECETEDLAKENYEANTAEVDIGVEKDSVRVNEEPTEINTEPTGVTIESTEINTEPTGVYIESTGINAESTEVNEESAIIKEEEPTESLLSEMSSKRPVRRKAKQTLHYDEGSDEDPFANIELSDDEPRRKKSGRYNSDDEYIPGMKRGNTSSSDLSDSEIDNELDDLLKQQRKKKCFDSPRKRGRKPKEEKEALSRGEEISQGKVSPQIQTIKPVNKDEDDDIEICLETSVINKDKSSPKKWGTTHEFEDFLAKKIQGTGIKIKKSKVEPLKIPVINANEIKKSIEMCTQTSKVETAAAAVQTTTIYDIPMKDNIILTQEQSEKACEFLNGIVKTTAELGELMTNKSQDFMKKKINTENVTDTFKMDYCVRKSFLLFKLAKHNLMQMEEDLAKQYDEFLNANNLMQYREKPKVLEATSKSRDSDSDCEIIDAPVITRKPKKQTEQKPKFNPKTVFLNKELSIKIAKKPSEDKKLNIKGRNTVWLNESVMVKKVKPTQSFLAQDSRNKKPPDYVTLDMVSNFFKEYYRQQALMTCARYVTTDWLVNKKGYQCCYFFTKPNDFAARTLSTETPSNSGLLSENSVAITNMKRKPPESATHINKLTSPKSLFSLCAQTLLRQLHVSPPNVDNIIKCGSLLSDQNANDKKYPDTLYSLCINSLNDIWRNSKPQCSTGKELIEKVDSKNISSLNAICCKRINELIDPEAVCSSNEMHRKEKCNDYSASENNLQIPFSETKKETRRLSSLCTDFFQNQLEKQISSTSCICRPEPLCIPDTLQHITYKNIVELIYKQSVKSKNPNLKAVVKEVQSLSEICLQAVTKFCFDDDNEHSLRKGLTINSVNTLTEEAFLNMEEPLNPIDNEDYYEEDDTNFYEDDAANDFENSEDHTHIEESNWISQVQMKELKSCVYTSKQANTTKSVEAHNSFLDSESVVARIKIEPEEDDLSENVVDSTIVKAEPLHNADEMTIIPEDVITKSELTEDPEPPRAMAQSIIQRRDSASYDVDTFEAFVSANKMMHAINEYENTTESEVFSQSASRIRRQFEPDWDTEADMTNSLLVPQTFEPLHIENAKDCLMESSDDENSISKKAAGKKKPERRRGRPKKDSKLDKAAVAEKPSNNEIAILTRRMRDRIRQEEKKVVSSDSESENTPLVSKKDKELSKDNKDSGEEKTRESTKEKASSKTKPENKPVDGEIQCNNVDSTEQVNENIRDKSVSPDNMDFSGFSAVDLNQVSNYQKCVKYVHDKILSTNSETNVLKPKENKSLQGDNDDTPIINPEEPIELLECTPTLPDYYKENSSKTLSVLPGSKEKKEETKEFKEPLAYTERFGWHCYPMNGNDSKLYLDAQIILEKLPESFVETYFMYQDITDRNKEDMEVDKLINLQTLNRSSLKEGKSRTKSKGKSSEEAPSDKMEEKSDEEATLSAHSDHYDELTPSEDEGGRVEDEIPPTINKPQTENNLAKNLLMDDESEDEGENKVKVKKEPGESEASGHTQSKLRKNRPGPKSKKLDLSPEDLMLTADKMMNKELNLLHAPVVLDDDVQVTPSKGPVTRNKHKNSIKTSGESKRIKNEDDSSSEEEKQWFTIKEKLLKKMINKKDTTREDDAKRAKLVSEFIEKRGDLAEKFLKRRPVRGRRSTKRMLERQKQLRVLTRELFGDASNDASHQGKGRNTQTYFKGRRNIRKVINKKALAKSTVKANMEEFERKRRLNIRQNKLRELLRCEEGVNVLVINNEVCLEYDFEQHRPIVTIHSFFTKVMKAHQYEGVKFMWDACFESLERIEAGHPGGGCILAHCMGLGKTLQVLALLHTVLTHPRVGMKRVLVCCPLSTVLNWVDEIHKWIGPVTNQIKVFELSKLKKTYERAYQLEDWYNGGGIFIIGYELFRSLTTLDPFLDDVRPTIVNKIRTALLEPGPDIIICDEGHLLKNDCSVLAVAMSRVMTKRRIVLTGTPMQNNLREYYCMVNFIKPNLLGTYSEYSNRFENPIMNGQHRDSREEDIKLMKARTHILHKVLEGCLQRQEASVLYPYLPKKHEYTVFVSLTKCQWDLYKHYLESYAVRKPNNRNSILRDFHILQKIWSHPRVLHYFQSRSRDEKAKVKEEKLEDELAHEELHESEEPKPGAGEAWWLQYLRGGEMLDTLHSSYKFQAVFRILDECIALDDKVLIFSTSLFTMDALEYFLKKMNNWSLGQEYYRLDGSVPAEVRQKWCREFNAENNHKTKLFLISTRAGSLGLNMTGANRVIILDTSWNPAHDIQSIFRVYRFGQKKDCYIYRLVALGTMEQKIYERSVTKQAVACRVVDEQQIDRHYNMADLTELYKYDEAGVGVAGGVAVGVEDVVLLRVARDSSLHAVHEHDSLLRGSGEQGLPEHERNAAWMQFQQEHATKQMQNDLESQRVEAISGTAPDHGYALAGAGAPEPGPAPAPEPKPSARRGRKSAVVSCCIPIQPELPQSEPEQQMDSDKEQELVRKIMDILVEHDFASKMGPRDLGSLVTNVRKIVASGRIEPRTDELTVSIATVLRQYRVPLPALTDIVCESVNNACAAPGAGASSSRAEPAPAPAPEAKPRKKEKIKKGYVYEEVPLERPKETEDFDGRTRRRRAALAAEKNFDTVIDLDDDSWQGGSDSEFIPNTRENLLPDSPVREQRTEEITPDVPVYPKHKKKSTEGTKGSKPSTSSDDVIKRHTGSIDNSKTESVSVNSIDLLSDDDEVAPKRTETSKSKRKSAHTVREDEEAADDENVPLHPSLLTNENFIKIVAHTYLTGNPMLDEDAATLAAQYSTNKALKEFESTGKPIESGPIYDIAVKVLGKEVLKKLQETKVTAQKAVPKPRIKEKPVEAEPEPKRKPIKLTIKNWNHQPATSGVTPPAPAPVPVPVAAPVPTGNVVPVGMFTRAVDVPPSERPQPTEECILPDDDDIIVSDLPVMTRAPPPPPSSTHPAAPGPAITSAPPTLGRRNAQQLVLNTVRSDNSKKPTSAAPAPTIITLNPATSAANPIIVRAPPAPAPAPAAPEPNGAYISLDSDDEEPAPTPGPGQPASTSVYMRQPVPAPSFAPVPVTLTAVNAAAAAQIIADGPSASSAPSLKRIVVPTPVVSGGSLLLNPSPVRPRLQFPSKLQKVAEIPPGAVPIRLTKLPGPPPVDVPKTIPPQKLATPDAPPAVPTGKTNKRVCKPGDILRITNSGQIEVLNRGEPSPPPAPADERPPGPVPQPRDAGKAVPKPAYVKIAPKQPHQPPPPPPPQPRPVSPSPPPFDPLSILKDVVHIEADDYANLVTIDSGASDRPESKTDKNKGSWLQVLTHNKSRSSAATSKTGLPPTKPGTGSTPAPAKSTSITIPSKVVTRAKTTTTSKQNAAAAKESKQPANPKFLGTVDLTDLPDPTPASSQKQTSAVRPDKRKSKTENTPTTSTGSNIVITARGKTLSKVILKPYEMTAKKPQTSGTSVLEKKAFVPTKPKVEDTKKRPPAPVKSSPAKKKKTEKLLTLEDFDVDDIGDIIELN